MLIFTLGCAAMYASAIALKSDLPGSPVVMCHQSTVTGSAAAADGAADPAALGAAALGAAALAGALLAAPPPEQALIVSARTPSNPSVRFGFDMTCPPVIRHSSSGGCGACLVRLSPPDGHPAQSIAGVGGHLESFGLLVEYFRHRTLGTRP